MRRNSDSEELQGCGHAADPGAGPRFRHRNCRTHVSEPGAHTEPTGSECSLRHAEGSTHGSSSSRPSSRSKLQSEADRAELNFTARSANCQGVVLPYLKAWPSSFGRHRECANRILIHWNRIPDATERWLVSSRSSLTCLLAQPKMSATCRIPRL